MLENGDMLQVDQRISKQQDRCYKRFDERVSGMVRELEVSVGREFSGINASLQKHGDHLYELAERLTGEPQTHRSHSISIASTWAAVLRPFAWPAALTVIGLAILPNGAAIAKAISELFK